MLGEVSQWDQALRFDNLTALPVHSASWQLVCCDQAASCSCHHVFPSMREQSPKLMARIPTYLNSSGLRSQQQEEKLMQPQTALQDYAEGMTNRPG